MADGLRSVNAAAEALLECYLGTEAIGASGAALVDRLHQPAWGPGIGNSMKFRRLLSSTSALLLGLAGCAPGPLVERPPAGAAPGPALWQVADEDTTIYLFGTVHALPKDTQWFDGRVERAFAAADELVTEIVLSDVTTSGQSLAAAGMLPEGQNLRELMKAEDRMQYEEALVTLGLRHNGAMAGGDDAVAAAVVARRLSV
jgi:hypothetical protein